MAANKSSTTEPARYWEALLPERQSAPVVFSSPHSGKDYPPDFVASSPLDLPALENSRR